MISIVIPLYNKESVIKKTLDSILAQPFQDYEIVVVDDGSTDNSVEVVKEYNDPKILLYSQKNSGPSSARNFGVNKSNGDWIIFLDADDTLCPGALEVLIAPTMNYQDIDMVCGNFNIICGDKVRLQTLKSYKGIVPNKKRMKWLFMGDCYPRPGAALIKKELLAKYPFPEELRRYEDDYAMIQWTKNARSIYLLPDAVLNYFRDTAAASKPSKDYNKDLIFHLDFENASFWEKCILGLLYGSGLKNYPEQKAFLKQKYGKFDFYRFFAKMHLVSRLFTRRFILRK